MGWPRKNVQMGVYKESSKSFALVDFTDRNRAGFYGIVANAIGYDPEPGSLCYASASTDWVRSKRRIEWSELPAEWKKAFARYMRQGGDTFNPRKVRGFFRIGENNADHVRRRQVRRGEQQRHPHGVPAR